LCHNHNGIAGNKTKTHKRRHMSEASFSLGYEVSLRLALKQQIAPAEYEALKRRIQAIAVSVFHERFANIEMAFDVEIREGSLWVRVRQATRKIAPWIVGAAVFLGHYKDAREGAERLAQDVQWVVEKTRTELLNMLNEEFGTIVQLETDERAGILARIAVATAEYKAGRITAEVCVDKIKRELDAIALSEHRAELAKALTSYLRAAYGDQFFEQVQESLGFPPSRPRPGKPGVPPNPLPPAGRSKKKEE
jgi:hypothetical protein